MKMKKDFMVISVLIAASFLFTSLILPGDIVRSDKPEQQKDLKKGMKPDIPQILEFKVDPSKMYPGQTNPAIFSWRVEPVPGGSSMSRITITRAQGNGPMVNYSGTDRDRRGRHEMNVPESQPAGRTTYVLTAENTANNNKSSTVTFEMGTMEELADLIQMDAIYAAPREVPEGSGPFELKVSLLNRSSSAIEGVRITVDLIKPIIGSTRVGESTNITLDKPGRACSVRVNEIRIGDVPGHYDIRAYLKGTLLASGRANMDVVRTIKVYGISMR